MRHSLLTATVFLVGFGSGTLFGTAGSKTNATAVSVGVEFVEQQALLERFVDAWLDGDVDRTVDLYTDNTVYMVPGAPMIHGHESSVPLAPCTRCCPCRDQPYDPHLRPARHLQTSQAKLVVRRTLHRR